MILKHTHVSYQDITHFTAPCQGGVGNSKNTYLLNEQLRPPSNTPSLSPKFEDKAWSFLSTILSLVLNLTRAALNSYLNI